MLKHFRAVAARATDFVTSATLSIWFTKRCVGARGWKSCTTWNKDGWLCASFFAGYFLVLLPVALGCLRTTVNHVFQDSYRSQRWLQWWLKLCHSAMMSWDKVVMALLEYLYCVFLAKLYSLWHTFLIYDIFVQAAGCGPTKKDLLLMKNKATM